jgi:hypothetical protein
MAQKQYVRIPVGKARTAASSGDYRQAVALLERSFKEAKKEHDLPALRRLLPVAEELAVSADGRPAKSAQRLAYAANQTIDFLERPEAQQAIERVEDRRVELKRKEAERHKKRQEKKVKRDEKWAAFKEENQRRKKAVAVWPLTFNGEDKIIVQRHLRVENTYRIDATVTATVVSGEAARTHPTVVRVVALGLIGAAWWKKAGGDQYLLVNGSDWAEVAYVRPKEIGNAHRFAQAVDLAARSSGATDAAKPGQSADVPSTAEQLERLAKLHAEGALTDGEFVAAKQRVFAG